MRSILLLGLLLAACGGKSAASPETSTQCPDSSKSCLTAPDCAWDSKRACMYCRCSAPGFKQDDYTPQGPPAEN